MDDTWLQLLPSFHFHLLIGRKEGSFDMGYLIEFVQQLYIYYSIVPIRKWAFITVITTWVLSTWINEVICHLQDSQGACV